jgi:hypothetical protein
MADERIQQQVDRPVDTDDVLYPGTLGDNVAIAKFIASLSTDDVDEEMIEEYFCGCGAVLKLFSVDSIREGNSNYNIRSKTKERKYKKMDPRTMPPILVSDDEIEDGNHRYRVVKARGSATIWAYQIIDEEEVQECLFD